MESRSVPGRDTSFEISILGSQYDVTLAEDFIEGRIAVRAARLTAGNRIRGDINIRGRWWYELWGRCRGRPPVCD